LLLGFGKGDSQLIGRDELGLFIRLSCNPLVLLRLLLGHHCLQLGQLLLLLVDLHQRVEEAFVVLILNFRLLVDLVVLHFRILRHHKFGRFLQLGRLLIRFGILFYLQSKRLLLLLEMLLLERLLLLLRLQE